MRAVRSPIAALAAAVLLAACSAPTPTPTPGPSQTPPAMAGMRVTPGQRGIGDLAPLVRGLYNGMEVTFIHTEASDPQVANMLTRMMGPQVVLVPGLSQSPEAALANVYVFTNGVAGGGPLGFQPDVFDTVPGDESYSPLRKVNMVTWQPGRQPKELRSEEDLRAAESAGEVSVTATGTVVNMPILEWPGGHR